MKSLNLDSFIWHNAVLLDVCIRRTNDRTFLISLYIEWPDETRNEIIFEYCKINLQLSEVQHSKKQIDTFGEYYDVVPEWPERKETIRYEINLNSAEQKICIWGNLLCIL